MIIRVQHTETLAFADSEGRWVADRAAACEFETTHEAVHFCGSHTLYQVQLCYEFPDQEKNFTLRISNAYLGGMPDRKSNRPTGGSSPPSP